MKPGIVYILFSLIMMASCHEEIHTEDDIAELPLFELLPAASTGVDFSNVITEDRNKNIISYQGYYDGGGVAVADFNNDGLQDIFFTANLSANKLYINQGNFQFIDQTSKAGLEKNGFGWCNGVTVVDINNDGWMDMYVCRSGNFKEENRKNQLFINNGDLTFTERASFYGLDHAGYSTQAAFFDYDRDGDLDMYLGNYGPMTGNFDNETTMRLRKQPDEFAGDKLFENRAGNFVDVTKRAGLMDHKFGFAQSVGVGDFNGDGWDDLYICNDFFEADYLYYNNGNKTFSDRLTSNMNHISNSSMGNDIADFNNDGLLDILVLDMVAEDNRRMKENMGGYNQMIFNSFVNLGFHYQYMFNTLQMNNGNETFSEIAHMAGISNTDWSWASLFADFDNDGKKDLYITNGLKRDARNLTAKYQVEEILRNAYREGQRQLTDEEWNICINSMPSEKIKNYMCRNSGDLTFQKVTDNWGLGYASFSNGAAYGDLDNDGDLDLVVNNISDKAFIFENTNPSGNFVKVKLEGSEKNLSGLGTKIEFFHGDTHQLQQKYFTHGFRSSMADDLHFGLGADVVVDSVIATWPDGKMQKLTKVKANQTILLKYAEASKNSVASKLKKEVFFRDVTKESNLNHIDKKTAFDDFKRERLLPYKLSTLGPVIAKGDVNDDGYADVFIGGSKGYPSSIFLQNQDGKFKKSDQPDFLKHKKQEDGGAEFFDADNDGDLDIYVTSGGNRETINAPDYQDRLYLNDGTGKFLYDEAALPKLLTSSSCVVTNDFDKDGDLDLFVGGRLIPGLYPLPANSYLLENRNGQFVDVSDQKAPNLHQLGMVTCAKWVDYDLDGDEDLIVAGEWMPITILQNNEGHFIDVTDEAGLGMTSGWWQTINVSDFDKDGDLDIVAGNLGLNSKFKASQKQPFEVFAGDLDNNGTHDIVLAYWQEGKLYPLRDRLTMIEQFPFINDKFPTFELYAKAQIKDIFSEEVLEKSTHLKVHSFASSYLENKGNGVFDIINLPNEAQISSINSIISTDVNGDGNLDLIMAGNIYDMEAETVRNDASFGHYFEGDGAGNFEYISNSKSGLKVGGDVKSSILIETSQSPAILFGKAQEKVQVVRINK